MESSSDVVTVWMGPTADNLLGWQLLTAPLMDGNVAWGNDMTALDYISSKLGTLMFLIT